MASFLLGRNAVAYWNKQAQKIGDVGAGPDPNTYVGDWLGDSNTEVAGNVTDVSLNVGSDFADGTTRETASSGFASQIPVLKNGEVTFEMRYKPVDPAAPAPPPYDTMESLLITQWLADSTIALVFLDQPKATSKVQGLAANWAISLEFGQALRDIQRISVTVTIADSGHWYTA